MGVSAQGMNWEMNVSVHRFSPSSPVTTGTGAASGANVPFQHRST